MKTEISLKEIFTAIWKGRILIGIIALSMMIVVGLGAFIYDNSTSQVSTILTLQWNGINQGEYPNGLRFDYTDTIEPYVISNALDESGLNLDITDVKEHLSLTPIIPDDTLLLIQQSLEDGEPLTYYASNYKLVLDNGALGINVADGTELVNNIIDFYRADFERKYISQAIIFDYTSADFSLLDYIESYEVLKAQVDLIENAMENKLAIDSTFVSPTLNIGFNDVLVATQLLQTIEIDQISSRVNTYLLTKDEEYLITKYSYDITEKTLELDKMLARETDTNALITAYAGSVTTILIPGVDSTKVLEIDSYYDTLFATLVNIQQQIAELENDILYLESQIDMLEGTDPTFTVTPEKQAEEAVKVEAYIASASDKIGVIVEDANSLLLEHNTVLTSNIIKPLTSPQYESSVSTILFAAVGLVVGAGIGVVIVLFKNDWDK